jgi:hypothetical protein
MKTSRVIHLCLSFLTLVLGLGTCRGSSFAGLSGSTEPTQDPPSDLQGADSAPVGCDPDNDDATQLNAVTCGPPSLGAPCSVLCAEIGASCISQRLHPTLGASIAKGLLSGCCSCKEKAYCEYVFSNGDRCKRFLNRLPGFEWICSIPGGK